MPEVNRNSNSDVHQEFPHMNYRVPDRPSSSKMNDELERQRNDLRNEVRNEMKNELRVNEMRMQEMKKNEMLRRKQELRNHPKNNMNNINTQVNESRRPPQPQDDTRLREMEAELNQLRKKAMIQDKLLKKIKKQAFSSMNEQ
jgi:hypothetical protein